jgi:Zn-dependent protease
MLKQSDDLNRAIRFAHIVAEEHKAPYLQTEHVLLGFVLDAAGPATQTIEQAGIKRKELWDAVAGELVDGSFSSPSSLTKDGHLTYLLDRAKRKAQDGGFASIHSLHLLAILLEDESGGKHLRQLGLTPDAVEAALEQLPRQKPPPKPIELSYKARQRRSELQIIKHRLKNAQVLKQVDPIFIGILVITIASAVLLAFEIIPAALGVFLFVLNGWIASVCLHEYGHAIVAYALGDDSILDKGYLTLNPIRYAHGFLSVILPILFLLLGGIGLPGGAVYVDRSRLRNFRYGSAVSAAGPAMTLLVAVICCIPLWIFYPFNILTFDIPPVWAAVGMLAMLQITALFFNLIPIPGVDGYGIIEPWLPAHIQLRIAPIRRFGLFLIYILFFAIPGVNHVFWSLMYIFNAVLGVNPLLFHEGLKLFRFWAR